jgi:hypothetical protein
LKYIPLKNLYIEFNKIFIEKYKIRKANEIKFYFEQYFNNIKYLKKINNFIKKLYINFKYKSFNKNNNKQVLFKKFYKDFLEKNTSIIFKYKIPTRIITEMRVQRIPSLIFSEDKTLHDYVSMGLTDEMHQYVHYRDLSKKSCIRNVVFKTKYIYRKYPYKINNNNLYYKFIIQNYFNIIDTGIKISKKFIFFDKNKLRNFNKLSHRLLNKIDTVYSNQLLKYKYWDKVFFFNRLNKKNLDF